VPVVVSKFAQVSVSHNLAALAWLSATNVCYRSTTGLLQNLIIIIIIIIIVGSFPMDAARPGRR
jgi:hypothetical protein